MGINKAKANLIKGIEEKWELMGDSGRYFQDLKIINQLSKQASKQAINQSTTIATNTKQQQNRTWKLQILEFLIYRKFILSFLTFLL